MEEKPRYIRKRVRRRSFVRKHWLFLLVLFGAAVCFGTFFVFEQIDTSYEVPQSIKRPPASTPNLQHPKKLGANERLVYPYSVIPGGVQSREELASAIAGDPIVAKHYERFSLDHAKIIRAGETQFMHVAYRLKDKLYWTSKKIRIPQGETLITDGKEIARTRCGNRVSAVPLEPVSEEEPLVETFERPEIAELEMPPETGLEIRDVSDLEPYIPVGSLNAPEIPKVPQQKYVPQRRLTHYRPLFVVRPNDVVVPEPGTLSLLGIGLAGLFSFRFFRKK